MVDKNSYVRCTFTLYARTEAVLAGTIKGIGRTDNGCKFTQFLTIWKLSLEYSPAV